MVSVIMPTFNRAYSLERAINSVFCQSYRDWELIIVDDGSMDNTKEIVEKYLAESNKIRFIKNNRKKGPAGARNTGISSSKGEYIAFLDSDDEWMPNHLEECLNALKTTGYEVCSALWKENYYGKVAEIEKDVWYNSIFDKMLPCLGINRREKLWVFDDRLFEHIIMTGFYCYHINTVVASRKAIERVNGFNETYDASEDLEFMFKLIEQNNLVTVNSHHFIYYYGYDNIYAFINRNEVELNEILTNKDYVKKLSINLKNKIKLFKETKELVRTSNKVINKKEAEMVLNEKIFIRSLTLACINKAIHVKIQYLLNAALFVDSWKKFGQLLTSQFFDKKNDILCFD